mmetsp:Transcript_984/g.2166  ORF Transcript_984/g.2166 Transcript_984/m.2166 type:complete len:232 (-) Transcript_984:559-1254(-)
MSSTASDDDSTSSPSSSSLLSCVVLEATGAAAACGVGPFETEAVFAATTIAASDCGMPFRASTRSSMASPTPSLSVRAPIESAATPTAATETTTVLVLAPESSEGFGTSSAFLYQFLGIPSVGLASLWWTTSPAISGLMLATSSSVYRRSATKARLVPASMVVTAAAATAVPISSGASATTASSLSGASPPSPPSPASIAAAAAASLSAMGLSLFPSVYIPSSSASSPSVV